MRPFPVIPLTRRHAIGVAELAVMAKFQSLSSMAMCLVFDCARHAHHNSSFGTFRDYSIVHTWIVELYLASQRLVGELHIRHKTSMDHLTHCDRKYGRLDGMFQACYPMRYM